MPSSPQGLLQADVPDELPVLVVVLDDQDQRAGHGRTGSLKAKVDPAPTALVTRIVGPDRPAGLAAALPYGIVIRNATSQAIAAVDTVWTSQNQVLLNAADTLFNRPMLYVKPGQAVLAIPPGLLQNQGQLRIFANGAASGLRLANFQNPGAVNRYRGRHRLRVRTIRRS